MKQLIQDIFRDILTQVFGVRKQRRGILTLTNHAYRKMAQYKIDTATFENAFKHGDEYRPGKISHKYTHYAIGLYYRLEERSKNPESQSDNRYVITTCWRGR
jgi:hypothetical protein